MVRRAVIEALDVTATLTFKDGQKTLQAKCALGENIFVLSSVIPEPVVREETRCGALQADGNAR
jgi:hypothetical protein